MIPGGMFPNGPVKNRANPRTLRVSDRSFTKRGYVQTEIFGGSESEPRHIKELEVTLGVRESGARYGSTVVLVLSSLVRRSTSFRRFIWEY